MCQEKESRYCPTHNYAYNSSTQGEQLKVELKRNFFGTLSALSWGYTKLRKQFALLHARIDFAQQSTSSSNRKRKIK